MKKSFDETIFEEANSWIKLNQKVVLATVIQTWGSSPRQIGSRMIVNENGDFLGSVSGGCVESNVISECLELIKKNNSSALALIIKANISNKNTLEKFINNFFIINLVS